MRREFEFFDEKTISEELASLPDRDLAKLAAVMTAYETAGFGNPYPAQIDAYEEGVFRIRHVKNSYAGRALFYVSVSEQGYQRLTVLTVYKKEGQKMPEAVWNRAVSRMAAHRRRKEKP